MAKKNSNKQTETPAATPTPAAAQVPPAPPIPGAAPAPAAPPVPPAPAAPVVPKVEEPEANGVRRPSAGTATRSVWDRADALSTSLSRTATRKEVVDACVAEGINSSTATTQFGKWAKHHGFVAEKSPGRVAAPASEAAPATAAPVNTPAEVIPVNDDGKAWDAGYEGYKRAVQGEQVTNPYVEGTEEANDFTLGWNKCAEDNANAATSAA